MFLGNIVPTLDPKLITKLRTLGLNTYLCNWILEFLTGHPQVVKVGNNTSASLILSTGAPQGCMFSPLLYSLFTPPGVAPHNSTAIIKFADGMTGVGLIIALMMALELCGATQSWVNRKYRRGLSMHP